MKQKPQKQEEEDTGALSGKGMGETIDFLSQENHIFLNKLTYICKNYDTSFKDVSHHPLL